MSVPEKLKEEVRQRAAGRCEYCRMPDQFSELRFQVDHVIAEQHGGPATLDNLAWACPRCNKHKGPNLSGLDRETGGLLALWHPRRDKWTEHFSWEGAVVTGRTPKGRVTVALLQMNHPDAVLVRQALMEEGVFFAASQ